VPCCCVTASRRRLVWAHPAVFGVRCAPLGYGLGHLRGAAAVPAVSKVRTAEDDSILDRQTLPDWHLYELDDWCAARGWTTPLQDLKLYCVPAPITRKQLLRGPTAEPLKPIAAGDSRLDAGILELDIAIRPWHGELDSGSFTLPNLTVTSASGVLAGEDILRFVSRVLTETLTPIPQFVAVQRLTDPTAFYSACHRGALRTAPSCRFLLRSNCTRLRVHPAEA